MHRITYLRKVPFTKYLISFLLFLSGLYFLIYENIFFGLLFTVIGFGLMKTEGSQIDFQTQQYRNIQSVFAIHVGKWKPLPVFDYVSVFKTTEGKRISVATASTVMREEIYEVNLFYENSNRITFYKTTNKEDAFKMAMNFHRSLNLKVLDATNAQSVWITT